MAVHVQIPSQLRALTAGAAVLDVEAEDVKGLIDALESRHAGLRERLVEPSGDVRRFVRIFVNEEDIRFLGGNKYTFQDGDEVLLVPSIAGGNLSS